MGCGEPKRLLLHGRDRTVAESLDYSAVWQAAMFGGADVAEGLRAYTRGKQPATYEDLPPKP